MRFWMRWRRREMSFEGIGMDVVGLGEGAAGVAVRYLSSCLGIFHSVDRLEADVIFGMKPPAHDERIRTSRPLSHLQFSLVTMLAMKPRNVTILRA